MGKKQHNNNNNGGEAAKQTLQLMLLLAKKKDDDRASLLTKKGWALFNFFWVFLTGDVRFFLSNEMIRRWMEISFERKREREEKATPTV